MLKLMSHLHKNRIHVGRSKFHCSVLSIPYQSCYSVIFLQLEVGPIIIGLVVDGVSSLEDKWRCVVGLDKMCVPIIEVDFMGIKEEDLWIELAGSTGPTE